MALINLKDIAVSYDGKTNILKKLNLDIEKGKLVSLLGPSGCGKTTTLRVISGFLEPTGGQFIFDGKDYTKIPVNKRNFGMVFQSYALFPHLNVFDNIAFGLKMRNVDKKTITESVNKFIEIVDLKEYGKRYPAELSGGQRQRVAIARALVIKPDLLLLDEPLSNLDAKLRLKMRVEIRKLQQRFGITTVFVTHDQEECFSISDKVAVMNKGVIEQYDTPEKIYSKPNTEFVAKFVGFENFIDLEYVKDDVFNADCNIEIHIKNHENVPGKIKATIRPDDIKILASDFTGNENILDGTIEVRTYLGKAYQYSVNTKLGSIIVNNGNDEVYDIGNEVKLYLPSNKLIIVKKSEEE
ncbi:ABC transporter ATP-binding protein [Clostridium coskatii]|uniref:Spermidine/putrescine import ATP-binding protein PotA n=1 Tax=Clostridium coskatii TaxID=1705578 RepID=A0A162LGL0_9CLOT|nr:ABC transporter ATP-binding protein [Clostridium coskatii]OAA93246.1 Spermidine/putrescine import ATP-binding protein PotA [Clostridium coskatii]OBR95371.1 spermidine/putrescine import ATP-binding protein PotA [Clostridium coskatii]